MTKRLVHQLFLDTVAIYDRRLPGSTTNWVLDDRHRRKLTVTVCLGVRHRFVAWGSRLDVALFESACAAKDRCGYAVDAHVTWTKSALLVGSWMDATVAFLERLLS